MIKTSTRAQGRRIDAKRRRARVPAKINATHPLGNRATRQAQAAFDRKDSRSKKPSTTIVMKLVDKNKSVQSKLKAGVLIYIERETAKPKVDILLEWRKQNPYPYPVVCKACKGTLCAECYPFYNPNTDTIEKIRASLMMTREEYKAASQGKTFIPKRKKYEYAK